jgi:hypothetical protein
MKYYVLEIQNDVTPIIHGPYSDWKERDDHAILLRASDPEMRHGLFPIDLDEGQLSGRKDALDIGVYHSSFFADDIDYTIQGATP